MRITTTQQLFWLTFLTIAFGIAVALTAPSYDLDLPDDFTSPGLAAEFVRDAGQIRPFLALDNLGMRISCGN